MLSDISSCIIKHTLNTFRVLGTRETKMNKIIALKELSQERKGTECRQIIIIKIAACIKGSTRLLENTEESNCS
jgi:hypothetical protein